ncbi:hypothetical protein ABMD26_004378 [Pseudomonas sp. PvP001]
MTLWERTLWERVSARERASTVYQCSASPPSRAEPAPTVWERTLWERVSARERASTVYQCLRVAAFAGRARSHSVGAKPVGAGLCPRTGLHGVSVPPHCRLRGQSPLPQCGSDPCGSGSLPANGPPRCISASASLPSRAEPAPTVWERTLWERVSARERVSTVYQCLRIAAFAGRARSHSVGENPVGAGLCPRTGLHGVSVPPNCRLRGQSPLPQWARAHC